MIDRQEVEFKRVKEIHQDGRVQALAWSPRSSLLVAPKALAFATSGPDHKLRIFTSDLEEVMYCTPLKVDGNEKSEGSVRT